MNLTNFIVNG